MAVLRATGLTAGLLLGLAGGAWCGEVVEYYHTDAIGNVRAVTNGAGQVVERHDYLPFGEECTTGTCSSNPGLNGGQPRKFTGKERDAETGLDYFGARYYGSKIGRFTTVDPKVNLKASILNPQRWNRYAYGLNSPLRFNDPDGREVPVVVDGRMYNMGLEGGPAMSRQEATGTALLYGGAFLGAFGLAVAPVMPAAMVEAQIAAGSCVASPGCQNAVRGMAEGMSGAAPGSMGTVTAFESKAAARAAIEAMNLHEAQAGAAMRAIQRATTTSTIEIGTQESGSLVVSVSRAGRDGRQVMENVISPQGAKTVVQKAFDAAGKLVHNDPKTP